MPTPPTARTRRLLPPAPPPRRRAPGTDEHAPRGPGVRHLRGTTKASAPRRRDLRRIDRLAPGPERPRPDLGDAGAARQVEMHRRDRDPALADRVEVGVRLLVVRRVVAVDVVPAAALLVRLELEPVAGDAAPQPDG